MATRFPLQQWLDHGGEALPILAIIGIIAVVLFVSLAIHVAVCWFLSSCFARIPVPYRRQEPAMVWLLLIPCFNLVWVFFVLPPLADSYRAYFEAQGRTDVGDCGRTLAMLYCIGTVLATVLGCVPFVSLANCLIGPAIVVVLILFLIKAAVLKGQLPPNA